VCFSSSGSETKLQSSRGRARLASEDFSLGATGGVDVSGRAHPAVPVSEIDDELADKLRDFWELSTAFPITRPGQNMETTVVSNKTLTHVQPPLQAASESLPLLADQAVCGVPEQVSPLASPQIAKLSSISSHTTQNTGSDVGMPVDIAVQRNYERPFRL
jgi:hypothetical protein